MNTKEQSMVAKLSAEIEFSLLEALKRPAPTLDDQKEQIFRALEKSLVQYMGGDQWKNHVNFELVVNTKRPEVTASFTALTEFGRRMLVDLHLIPGEPVNFIIDVRPPG
jgi:hypothetical protein